MLEEESIMTSIVVSVKGNVQGGGRDTLEDEGKKKTNKLDIII